ncbi:ureidoglycolate lyase [Pararhizobium haloflavum]|uniref:ureidoglycolate lyase n=1 Tax=Pararhizobium haloflavum TaxID=2037914 RepID=UPI000C19F17A|nr:ureidoglycolate lyase [Pararhizobium haloflavum]
MTPTHRLDIAPLTARAFAPFGEVLDVADAELRLINDGNTERYHRLAATDMDSAGRAIVSLFRGKARSFPFTIAMMERHPDGSQAFWPLSGRPWLVVVAEDEEGRPGRPRAFLASASQGVNYRRNVWHHPLMALDEMSDFLIIDREGPGSNLEEFFYEKPYEIVVVPAASTLAR